MSENNAPRGTGWYGKARQSEAERAEMARKVEEWRRKTIDLNYRQVAVEAPGKMILALGQIAQQREIPFGEFVESVLAEYLTQAGIDWTR
jgi:hypothetical protein